MEKRMSNEFAKNNVAKTLKIGKKDYTYYSIPEFSKMGIGNAETLPFSIKVLLESALRNYDDYQVTLTDITTLANWSPNSKEAKEISYKPGRVILQDFTGVPCVVDLAAMRNGLKNLGGDYRKINPQVQCDLVIDHSVQIDSFGKHTSLDTNVDLEFKRNKERYEFLKWGQNAFENFNVVPPATGIVHQVNLEYVAKGVLTKDAVVYPDTCVGTDSHTTMINGLGVVGWGVGGIEAEAVMLGEPIAMLMPEVIGFQLKGKLKEGITATDLVLVVTEMLRKKGVVGKFVEFFGDGLAHLSLPDRATISNMAPEYGATIGIFPIDEQTLKYYKLTGRSDEEVELVESYYKAQNMFYCKDNKDPEYTDSMELDMSMVQPCLAGPKRPQDRINLSDMKSEFKSDLTKPLADRGFALTDKQLTNSILIKDEDIDEQMDHGAVVIAAITSCTNTSNPSVLIAAGLVAKKATELGLKVKKYVKTSFAPGSQVVDEYMNNAELMPFLENLGFHIVGYGCTTCIGNSGPLPEAVSKAIVEGDIVATSVLSGNRNFEGRVSPLTKGNYLASPPLVVAYALAGTVDINLDTDPLGQDSNGNDVYLKDIWPTTEEIATLVTTSVTAEGFRKRYSGVSTNNEKWNAIKSTTSDLYQWNDKSTYVQEPPFFIGMSTDTSPIQELKEAHCLVKVGDSITTDHISPAGMIALDSPAGKYLKEEGVDPKDFNSYGSRRGNDRVMTRGTFANVKLRNQLAPGTEGSWTTYYGERHLFSESTQSSKKTGVCPQLMSIYDASLKYKETKTPLIVLAGKDYGMGSSRDWAAKGTALLGVRAVIAESYERIHRSNLAGMGVLPLQFKEGESHGTLGLKGDETFSFDGVNDDLKPRQDLNVVATAPDGKETKFTVVCRLDTPVEIDYVKNGGILQTVLRKLA
ncbi:MAG: aconitate hydratase [Lysobacterales bacterium]|jgi:aconitate hydratase